MTAEATRIVRGWKASGVLPRQSDGWAWVMQGGRGRGRILKAQPVTRSNRV